MSTPKILTWLNTSKPNSNGYYPVWIRITYRGRRAELSTGVYIEKKVFKRGENPLRGSRKEVEQKNLLINNIRTAILTAYNTLLAQGGEISARKIKEAYEGTDKASKGVVEAFDYHNSRIKDLIPKGEFSHETLELFTIQRDQLIEFITTYSGNVDYPLRSIDYKFLKELEYWLKQTKNNKHNTVRKKFQRLKKILSFAVKMGWLEKTPMDNYPIREMEKEIIFLNDEELNKIKNTDLSKQSLIITRDRLLFSCFTGLGYKELSELTWNQVTKDMKGSYSLIVRRHKTHREFAVPLLKPALEILNRYKKHPVAIADGTCFPRISNQKYNVHLKDLATASNIQKKISTHTARKTFATWALTNGVPMETVSQILGHTNLRITQKFYGKIVNEKVSTDMHKLEERLAANE